MTTYQVAWILFGTTMAVFAYYAQLDSARTTAYWRGRKDGWDMHRRMIETKRKSDEVFDYEKN